ncbi:MAG: hypothetical protein A2V70_02935 [Planctomycetes bacterium RBG_13_63_9]|nr:MAG: hypothetical protein A2V70_02935 [Planctomycetes bacterium RBG_13_63_9]
MPRPTRQDADAPSHDSFLDIVANMVGILIILVMVVGIRAKNAPVLASLPRRAGPAELELEQQKVIEESTREDVFKAANEIRRLQNVAILQGGQRDALATMLAAAEHQLQSGRQQMDTGAQETFDLRQRVSESKLKLEQLRDQRLWAETTRSEATVVESYPTPLSRTVDGRQAHYQLRGGRIVPIPLDELVDRFKENAQRQKYRLLESPELTDTVGPLGGFRLRYTMVRQDISPETAMITGRGGSYAELRRWTLIPVSGQLGEPAETALAEGSEFRRSLSKRLPGRNTITIWTYPDSFAEFRQIKKDLYSMGYSVAARPLPHGVPISGSPEGSKSAAE